MKDTRFATIALTAMLLLAGCGTAPNLTVNPVKTEIASEEIEGLRVYKIEDVMGIGPAYAKKLQEAGMNNTKKFLAATRNHDDRAELAEKAKISETLILTWAHKVELMTIPGIGPEFSQLLEAVGVDSSAELAQRNPTNLQDRMAVANSVSKRKFVDHVPTVKVVTAWVEKAKAIRSAAKK
ncbi:MAG TPA: DUF4332 domain-containing protein [Cyanobacteria bacterium UBA8530]|nr:DUF4332 domain-containing protein [Cyanobacteria bacterium UBA8530]